MKPFLMIDVDGPLNPYARSNTQLRKTTSSRSDTPPEGQFHMHKLLGFKVWLNRWHGEQLLKLADVYDLVWATTWEHDANRFIGPRIGLPELPVIEFGKYPSRSDSRLHNKTEVITAYSIAHGRPFAWVDDEVGAYDGLHFARWGHHEFLTLWVDPVTGLTEEHFTKLREWAEELGHDEGP